MVIQHQHQQQQLPLLLLHLLPPLRRQLRSQAKTSPRGGRKKKKQKKKKKEKRERRERESSQGQGGVEASLGGGVKEEGEGEVVVDEEEGDGEVQVIDPPNDPPPSPSGFSKPWAPNRPPPEKRRRSPGQPRCCRRGARGINPFFPPPNHSHMTVMWIFRPMIRCFIRRNEGQHGGTWGKDASRGGGVWVWRPHPGAPLAPLQEAISAGVLPALNLLYDLRGVRFGTPHYLVLLQHWAHSGLVQAVARGHGCGLWDGLGHCAGPAPPSLRPGVPALVRGLGPRVLRSQVSDHGRDRGQTRSRAAPLANMAAPVAPVEAPSAAALFGEAMEALQAGRTNGSFEVLGMCVEFHF